MGNILRALVVQILIAVIPALIGEMLKKLFKV